MSYEHREGSGSLFKNDKKEAGTKQPDYRGTIMLGGVVYEIAGWIKSGAKGSFLSINGKVQEAREGSRKPETPKDESIPF